MKDDSLDAAFARGPEVPVVLAEQIRAQIERETKPVCALVSDRASLVFALLIDAAAAIAFAVIFGFEGWRVLSAMEIGCFLSVLIVAGLAAGSFVARSMRPGSGVLPFGWLGLAALAAYESLVLLFFQNYSLDRFLPQGEMCLMLGSLCALAAAIPLCLLVRRGFVVEPVKAGALVGLVSGLAGLTGLTLHCPVLTMPHTGVWHAGVIIVSVAVGALAGRTLLIRR